MYRGTLDFIGCLGDISQAAGVTTFEYTILLSQYQEKLIERLQSGQTRQAENSEKIS